MFDEVLSSFAFNMNLRQYSAVWRQALLFSPDMMISSEVGQCKLKVFQSCVESAWFQRLKLKYDKLLSNFAFNFK